MASHQINFRKELDLVAAWLKGFKPSGRPQETNFKSDLSQMYHSKPERFAEICQRFFRYISDDYARAQREVSLPALYKYTGYPLAENQFCFKHKGHGRALWTFVHRDRWFFQCRDPQCGIQGDVVGAWYLMVKLSGFAPQCWDKSQACGDLLARAEAGMIDLTVTELESRRTEAGANTPRAPKDAYYRRLEELIKNSPPANFIHKARLPTPVRLSVQRSHCEIVS